MKPVPSTVAVLARGPRAESLAVETLAVLAEFGVAAERPDLGDGADPAAHALAVVLADAAAAGRIAREFPGPVLFVPDGGDPEAVLEAVRTAASEEALVPVGVLASGSAGARNAGLSAVALLSDRDPSLRERYRAFREAQTAKVLAARLD